MAGKASILRRLGGLTAYRPADSGTSAAIGSLATAMRETLELSTQSELRHIFVYQPGGKSHDNVYSSFSDMYLEFSKVIGPKIIRFDDTHTTISLPYGIYDVENTKLLGNQNKPVVVQMSGAILQNVEYISSGLVLRNAGGTPNIEYTKESTLILGDRAGIDSRGGAATIFLTNKATLTIHLAHDSFLGNGKHSAVELDDNCRLVILGYQSSMVKSHALSGVGTVEYRGYWASNNGLNKLQPKLLYPVIASLENDAQHIQATGGTVQSVLDGVTMTVVTVDTPGIYKASVGQIVLVNTDSGNVTVELPQVTTDMKDKRIIVKRISDGDSKALIQSPSLIDNKITFSADGKSKVFTPSPNSTRPLAKEVSPIALDFANQAKEVVADGINWWVISIVP